jgi:hypothetical protein
VIVIRPDPGSARRMIQGHRGAPRGSALASFEISNDHDRAEAEDAEHGKFPGEISREATT